MKGRIPSSAHLDDEDDVNLIYKELEKLKAFYGKIAISFGLPPGIVEDIKSSHPKDNSSALNDVITSWVRQEHNVGKFGYPCWRKVVKAAIDGGNKLQAKKIAKNHPGTCIINLLVV